ncbi:Diaminopimelate epimerase protein [Pyrenophora teres f. maculata]|nr:Diaminopimelate epimerase protein [Pyrenophora teres f. maculata]
MTSSSKLEFVTLDVFTAKPYEGNPLAIVQIPNGCILSQDQKQTIAREFNLSETTFLHEKTTATEDDEWTVDIFVTTRELPFAGHPTVGTACYVLGRTARERGIESGTMNAKFNLKAGRVDLDHIHKKRCNKNEILAWQPQLAEAYQQGKTQAHDDFPVVSIVKGMTFVLVELENEEVLSMVSLAGRALVVDGLNSDWCDVLTGTYFFVRMGKSEDGTIRLRTRMIEGALEDPATGSAASDLAAYLSLTEGRSNETLRYEIIQGVEMGRRSEILIEIDLTQDRAISKLYLKGGAVEVMEGRLTV